MPDLLVELFSEEIPARMQAKAADGLKRLVTNAMVEAGLTYASAGAFATPRRLVLSVEGVLASSPDQHEERKGPRADAPEKALAGFLRATGLSKDQLEVRDDKKGQVYFAVVNKPGRAAADIIGEIIPGVIRNFPWPKSMRWGSGSLRWVRPLQSILCILSDEAEAHIVPFDVDGIASGDRTSGHRFMAPGSFTVRSFEDYSTKLKQHFVMLDGAERADHIWHDATNAAFAQGMEVVEDKGLLAEVAGLVEWPVVLMGDIGEAFLGLPPEVLQTSMREHQKFFSVRNPKTGRIEKYVVVANRETADNGATILAGNGKVLAARLSDAKFFWENDLRTVKAVGLEGMGKPLGNVTFHNKLGTVAEQVERIAALAEEIAPMVGADPKLARHAARVAKADLSSEMVYEFPDLQGVMGQYYALEAGLPLEVAEASAQHRSPLGPSDDVPTAPISVAVALADKIDTLTGFWAIDEKPTGSKDPYALRRAALGVIRILLDNSINLDLFPIIGWATYRHVNRDELAELRLSAKKDLAGTLERLDQQYGMRAEETSADKIPTEVSPSTVEEVRKLREEHFPLELDLLSFLAERLKVHLRTEGIRHDVIDACFQHGGQYDFVLLVNRVKALQKFIDSEDGSNLLSGFKRANNILEAEEKKDGVEYSLDPVVELAEAGAEAELFAALDVAEAAIAPALESEDFAAAMSAMAALRGPIDSFFDDVIVNAENSMVRRNRLCLLHRIRSVMNRVAVFSAIEG